MQRYQVDVGPAALQARNQLTLFQAFIDMKQAQLSRLFR